MRAPTQKAVALFVLRITRRRRRRGNGPAERLYDRREDNGHADLCAGVIVRDGFNDVRDGAAHRSPTGETIARRPTVAVTDPFALFYRDDLLRRM